MNRTTLLIPAFCGQHDEARVIQVLKQTLHNDLKYRDKENIPYTVRKERQLFFNKNIQKTRILLSG